MHNMKKHLTLFALAASATSVFAQSEDTASIGLDEVKVIASFATDRKTPVAVSTVTSKAIAETYGGSTELPEVLKVTPGVYATKSGGGVGDARINIRGFDQRNVAVLINGIPVNDMESGWVYWSNWAGLGDAVSSMQVQRGLGASKLAINSVGGTMNIITKTTDAKAGASFQAQMTNYGQYKATAYASTGLMKSGFAFTTVLSRTSGNSYIDGTWINGYSYFFTLAKRLGDHQQLVLTAIGAPQSHGQRTSGSDSATLGANRKFNADYGYLDGKLYNDRVNYYHKPQISLNHYYRPSKKMSLNSSLYYSIGHGGGSGRLGSSYARTSEGLLDFDAAAAFNANDPTNRQGGVKYAQRNSVNNHYWLGLLSTLNMELNDNLDLTLGIDARSYKGEHFREVRDVFGNYQWNDGVNGLVGVHPYASNYGNVFHVVPQDQRVAYDNDGLVKYAGLFGQLEYSKDRLSAFATGAINSTSNVRVDRMLYISTPERATSAKVVIPGYSGKVGANYNIDEHSNVYVNAGAFSRAPFFSFVFVNNSNDVVQNLKNEKALSFEAGYGYTKNKVALKASVYNTMWKDKSLLSGNITGPNGTITRALMSGANARHRGLELDMNVRANKNLSVGAVASLGDWRWIGDVNATVYSEIDPTVSSTVTSYVDGVHVGDAPQTQFGLQARQQMGKFYAGLTYTYNARFYAAFDPAAKTDPEDKIDAWKIPAYYQLDARAGYSTKFGKTKMDLAIQGFNLTDVWYWSDATDNGSGALAYGYVGFGRNFNFSAKFSF